MSQKQPRSRTTAAAVAGKSPSEASGEVLAGKARGGVCGGKLWLLLAMALGVLAIAGSTTVLKTACGIASWASPCGSPSPVVHAAADTKDYFDEVEVVDMQNRVFFYPHFLTDAEVDYVLKKASSKFEKSQGTGWRKVSRGVVYLEGEEKKEEVVRRIEEKVAKVTTVPPHEGLLEQISSSLDPSSSFLCL